jgi:hypothetical protein
MQNKANLLDTQINVSSILTKDYENARLYKREKNKPNQSQIGHPDLQKSLHFQDEFDNL